MPHPHLRYNCIPMSEDATIRLGTSAFTAAGWLGDRKGIEEQTKVWNKAIVDRSAELSDWVKILKSVHKRKIQIFAYANNHYAGYGPATIEKFRELWGGPRKLLTTPGNNATLFPT
jgi:uncharacterized protein YecE (DUF72 family)